jgi:hypothetical protein
MSHNCENLQKVQTQLAAKNNTKLRQSIFMDGTETPLLIETEKLDDRKRGKAVSMFVTLCPFCGEKWKADEVTP